MALGPNYRNVPMTVEARKAIDSLIVAMTVKHRRKFTISTAIRQAAEDITRELELAGSETP